MPVNRAFEIWAQRLRRAMEGFDSVQFEHVPREKNERADALARQGVEKSRKKAAAE